MADNQLAKHGEEIAAQYLRGEGFTVIEQGWECALGVVKIVAQEGTETVFVDVRTRAAAAFGHPLESITVVGLARLRRLAAAWCETHPVDGRIRIDAIAVIAPNDGPVTIEHLRRVF